jgi:hypothetical protein
VSELSDYERAMDEVLAELGEERPPVTSAELFAAYTQPSADAVERRHECGEAWVAVFRAALEMTGGEWTPEEPRR